jgi:CheY-like chemotaxis protein
MTEVERAAARRTALIVDPDADTRELYAFSLGRENWEVAQAVSGDDGYTRAVELQPDVIVTELVMPDVDGFELCRRLRSEPATCDIPLVVVTASALPRDLQGAAEAGGDVVLCKPCLPAELGALLARLVEQSRALWARSRQARDRAHDVVTRSRTLVDESLRWRQE